MTDNDITSRDEYMDHQDPIGESNTSSDDMCMSDSSSGNSTGSENESSNGGQLNCISSLGSCVIDFRSFLIDIDRLLNDGLYLGASLSKTTSWYSIMYYAVSNHLSYKAVEDLIALMKVYIIYYV